MYLQCFKISFAMSVLSKRFGVHNFRLLIILRADFLLINKYREEVASNSLKKPSSPISTFLFDKKTKIQYTIENMSMIFVSFILIKVILKI